MLSESARALGPQFEPRKFVTAKMPAVPVVSRRKLLAWAGASGAMAASFIALGISAPAAGAITTGLGEVRLVTLDDGSTVMLNTQTGVKIRYSDSERRVDLLHGEAYFTVVRDLGRPFVVDASGARLRAARAAFRVRKLEGKPLDILVGQGGLTLEAVGASDRIVLPANSRLVLPPSTTGAAAPAAQAISSDLAARELAWREGKIAFEGERLDQAAAEFARYSKTRIEIADPALAAEPVTGLFSAGDPMGFGRAVAGLFDAKIERQGDVVILSRRANQR
jgi:transmembrane sensor